MTPKEKELAEAMRLAGKTWEEIGGALNYDAETVRVAVLHRRRREPNIIYPAIKDYIQRECNGNIYSFACRCNMSKSTMYAIICGGEKPSRKSVAKILEETGLKYKEAFSK